MGLPPLCFSGHFENLGRLCLRLGMSTHSVFAVFRDLWTRSPSVGPICLRISCLVHFLGFMGKERVDAAMSSVS